MTHEGKPYKIKQETINKPKHFICSSECGSIDFLFSERFTDEFTFNWFN